VKELRRVPASQIHGAPWNWRAHPQAQKDALAGSIEELGFFDPLDVYEAEDGRLVLTDGHARRDLVDERIGPDTLLPVIVTDFTEAEAKKANLIKDPLAGMAQANTEQLAHLLRNVETNDDALKEMLAGLAAQNHVALLASNGLPEADPDHVPEPPDQATTQAGELWQLGRHYLYCGDAARAEDVDRLLQGAEIHLANCDPPYGVRVEPRSNNAIAAGLSSFDGPKHHQALDLARHPEKAHPTAKKLRAKDRPLINDFLSETEFDRLLRQWFGNIARVLLPGRCFVIWGGYANLGNYPPALKECGLYYSQAIVWDKEWPVLTRKDFMGAFELAFYGWREGAAHQFFGPKNATDLWHLKKVNPQSMMHLTEKPVELATRAIEYCTRPDENVLDLFGGSGSTLIGAEITGRRAFVMELDALYCDLIRTRYEQFTGQKPQLRSPG
jgi:DNA modification methylase